MNGRKARTQVKKMLLDHDRAKEMELLYRKQLLEIMQEWADHVLDAQYGGYATNFDENWKLTGRQKNIWAQARQSYMFAAIQTKIDNDSKWGSLSKAGVDFIVQHAYAGNGRWNYELSEAGTDILEGTTTIFTDLFVLMALSEFSLATRTEQYAGLINETFSAAEANVFDPNFKDIAPHVWEPGVERYSVYMIALNAAMVAGQVLGQQRVRPFIEKCMDKILCFFDQNDSGFLLESLRADKTIVDTAAGRQVTPGHIYEGMWFCMQAAWALKDNAAMERASRIIEKTCTRAIDKKHGGIIHRFDCLGYAPQDELSTDTGVLRPDDKVDWVQCESLYAFALQAAYKDDAASWNNFLELHDYCQKNFRPPQGGDWYPLLSADGAVLRKNKGGKHRVAFHVPRALMNLTLLFHELARLQAL